MPTTLPSMNALNTQPYARGLGPGRGDPPGRRAGRRRHPAAGNQPGHRDPPGRQVRLIDAALAASPGAAARLGICTECGMGRVDREDVPALLDLHRQIIAAS
jgi:hypothetical protein